MLTQSHAIIPGCVEARGTSVAPSVSSHRQRVEKYSVVQGPPALPGVWLSALGSPHVSHLTLEFHSLFLQNKSNRIHKYELFLGSVGQVLSGRCPGHPLLTTWIPFPEPTVEGENWLLKVVLWPSFVCHVWVHVIMIHKIRMCIRLSSLPLITYVCVCERETDRETWREGKRKGEEEGRTDAFVSVEVCCSLRVHLTF